MAKMEQELVMSILCKSAGCEFHRQFVTTVILCADQAEGGGDGSIERDNKKTKSRFLILMGARYESRKITLRFRLHEMNNGQAFSVTQYKVIST
jgi:hypothetical protein